MSRPSSTQHPAIGVEPEGVGVRVQKTDKLRDSDFRLSVAKVSFSVSGLAADVTVSTDSNS